MLNRKKRYRLTVKKQNASIPRRLNLLFFIIVLLFTVLILRLEQMQIGQQSFYSSYELYSERIKSERSDF